MSNARVLPLALERATREGFFDVRDPGASGTITWGANAHAIVHVVSAGAEARTLDSANKFAVGSTVFINLAKHGGDVTLSYNSTSLVLTAAGQFALFICCASDPTTNPETRTWGLVASSVANADANDVTAASAFGTTHLLVQSEGVARGASATTIATADVVTRAANAAGANLIPVSGGANKALQAATPVALGSHTITTGDAPTNAMLVAVINQLVSLGLFTGTAS